MRKYTLPFALAAGAISFAALGDDSPFEQLRANKLDVAVFGDAPYGVDAPFGGPLTDTSQLAATPAFIDAVNADPTVSLVLHVGDIHSGKQNCTVAYDQKVYDLWTAFQDPLIYTPGDNEWTDCHKKAQGGGAYSATLGTIVYDTDASGALIDYAAGDPMANLELVRSIFFSRPGRALGGPKFVLSQAFAYDRAHPSDAKYPENVMWMQSRVLFVTMDIAGGSNNDQDVWYGAPTLTAPQIQDIAERTDADLRWLRTAFTLARILRAKGVVLQFQADMWDGEKGPAHQLGFEGVFGFDDPTYGFVKNQYDANRDIVGQIAKQAASFDGTVLMLNGDSHVYRSENPLAPNSQCVVDVLDVPTNKNVETKCANDDWAQHAHDYGDVSRVHRIVVHGSTFPLEYLKLTIDPRANAPAGPNAIGPFSWVRKPQP